MTPDWLVPFAATLVDASIRITAVAALVAGLLLATRARASGVRHAAWLVVLGAMLMMPALPYCMPAIRVPVPAAMTHHPLEPVALVPPATLAPSRVAASGRPGVTTAVEAAPAASVLVGPPPATPPSRGSLWPIAGVTVYALGVLIHFGRLLIGWRAMTALARRSRRVEAPPDAGPVYTSELVATPVTIGVIAPRIVLPADWPAWPADKLRAVLAHERAHVQRRDPLVAVLARLNRCVFWFHPLAWWLERQLAATAEHACDDAGVRAIGEPRRYAEMLVNMAADVQRGGGRLSWQGLGVGGNGLLGQRIDRLLSGRVDRLREVSRTRRVVVFSGCAAIVFVVAACQSRSAPLPLQEDPQIREESASVREWNEFDRAQFLNLTAQQIAELEETVARNPDDLKVRQKLLYVYAIKGDLARIVGRTQQIEGRRSQITWFIAHQPDVGLPWAQYLRMSLDPTRPAQYDPEGYAAGRKLWLEQTAKAGASPNVLGNAASFLAEGDEHLAEDLLIRARAMEPGESRWLSELGRLYADALLGGRSHDPARLHSPFAEGVRKTLAESTDPSLLAETGVSLSRAPSPRFMIQNIDGIALGKTLIERALQIDPQSVPAHRAKLAARASERSRRILEARMNSPKAPKDDIVSALPDAERLMFSLGAAVTAYLVGNRADSMKDADAAKAEWDRAKQFTADALALAQKFPSDPDAGTAIYQSHIILGMLAFRAGNRKGAVTHLLDASKAPASEELAYGSGGPDYDLVAYLLKYGERESVIEFLERAAQVRVSRRDTMLADAASIRANRMPRTYQGIAR